MRAHMSQFQPEQGSTDYAVKLQSVCVHTNYTMHDTKRDTGSGTGPKG